METISFKVKIVTHSACYFSNMTKILRSGKICFPNFFKNAV